MWNSLGLTESWCENDVGSSGTSEKRDQYKYCLYCSYSDVYNYQMQMNCAH